jgi:hypothetical protein
VPAHEFQKSLSYGWLCRLIERDLQFARPVAIVEQPDQTSLAGFDVVRGGVVEEFALREAFVVCQLSDQRGIDTPDRSAHSERHTERGPAGKDERRRTLGREDDVILAVDRLAQGEVASQEILDHVPQYVPLVGFAAEPFRSFQLEVARENSRFEQVSRPAGFIFRGDQQRARVSIDAGRGEQHAILGTRRLAGRVVNQNVEHVRILQPLHVRQKIVQRQRLTPVRFKPLFQLGNREQFRQRLVRRFVC